MADIQVTKGSTDVASPPRWEPVGDKQYSARMGDREAVMAQLSRAIEAIDVAPEQVVLITNGDSHYETLHQKYLPDTRHVVDFFHVCEYLWDAACGQRDEHHDKKAFVGAAKDLLLEGSPEAVIAWLKMEYRQLPKRGPGTKSRRGAVKAAINYIVNARRNPFGGQIPQADTEKPQRPKTTRLR